jgi:hypothetical protein
LVRTAASKLFRFCNSHETVPKKRDSREVDADGIAELLNELAQRAKIIAPRLYLVDSPLANASAASHDYRHSSICITTGLLTQWRSAELKNMPPMNAARASAADLTHPSLRFASPRRTIPKSATWRIAK